jgi:hypothetical protein
MVDSLRRVLFLRRSLFCSYTNAFDFHTRQFATVANCAVIAFASLILERDHLFVFALLDNFSRDFCSGNERVAVRHVFSMGKHQHVAEGRCLAGIDIEKIDIDRIAFRDTKLPASSPDNCVSHKLFGERKAAQNSIDRPVWQTESSGASM